MKKKKRNNNFRNVEKGPCSLDILTVNN